MPHVLLVDDDVALLDALPRALKIRMPELVVDTCDSASHAVQQLKEIDYDAIVTDIKMPGIDGLALLSVIRRLRPNTPTLLITGHGEHDLAVQALRGGAYDFIQKPIDRDYFVASLRRALQVSELQRQVEAHKSSTERRADELEQAVHERTRELLHTNHAKDELLQQREQALAEARAAQRRLTFLVEASNLLTSLDFDTTLQNVAKLAVPTLAENCVVKVSGTDDEPPRRAVASCDAAHEAVLRDLLEREGGLGGWALEAVRALAPGAPGVIIDPSDLPAGFRPSEEQARYLQKLGERAVMLFPLSIHGRTLGTMAFGMGATERRYSPEDFTLAYDVARRCALAIDNARLYGESEAVREHLRRAVEAKDEFLALISHEMRTPLTSVYGSAQILWSRKDRLSEEVRHDLTESLARESERLRRIVEDLLVLARIEVGSRLVVEPVSVPAVVRGVLDSFSHFRPDRRVELDLAPDMPPLAAEPTYVEQVLHNLLSNADKYSPLDYPIEVHATIDASGSALISVLDRGIGIAPHEVDLIFERFYRSERTEAPGLGMGLTVCRRLVEALSGRIWATPRDGGGLEVSFTLPVWRETEVLQERRSTPLAPVS
jgi:signal transduction histidine kinase/FixJ family two-component response regulator